ncbi:MAG TPA: LysM peptidoglycan-binding domain-containing protein [Thermodesulfobacteriota bacterium]|nr:LysM peptidoglycan-binding domain-containing protein [Thermodesulfobacteriota bacterium]
MRLKLILTLILLGGVALAESKLPEGRGDTTIYVIRPGDSLWNISKRFFNNPLLWPRLWELNQFIDNPNLIYPGEVLSLKTGLQPSLANLPVVKVSPTVKMASLERIEPPPLVFFYSRSGHEGFISSDELGHMGTVLTSEPPKILLGEGDTVYTNVGSEHGVKAGDKFKVFRTSKDVFHPFTQERVGYKVAVLGELEIEEVLGERMSSARISNSYREITKGARIKPSEPFVKEVVLKKGIGKAEGLIVETLNNTELSGMGDIVYIDVGKNEAVVPGNMFSIYKFPRRTFDLDEGTNVIIPGAYIGKLVVLNVHEKTATGIITQSKRQIEKGDMVSLDL